MTNGTYSWQLVLVIDNFYLQLAVLISCWTMQLVKDNCHLKLTTGTVNQQLLLITGNSQLQPVLAT